MTWLLLVRMAFGAELVLDAKVPAEVYLSGHLVCQLAVPAVVHVDVLAGEHQLTVLTDGSPEELTVFVDPDRGARVVIGRTGLSADRPPEAVAEPAPAGDLAVPVEPADAPPHKVEFRSVSDEEIVLVLPEGRHRIPPGEHLAIDLAAGDHHVSVRGQGGTVIWATGTLHVTGDGLVVQLTDGRLPETAGGGGSFHPDGG